MTIVISYDRPSGCFIGHEPTRDLYSAGLTWQEALAATVDGARAWDRWSARSPAAEVERFERLRAQATPAD